MIGLPRPPGPGEPSGIVSPSALAVLRLMNSSNFIGCYTDRSDGLVPLRILSHIGRCAVDTSLPGWCHRR